MLVLTRSREEEIRIGDDVVIRVLDVKGDRVRIGISAPAHISVHRQEVYLEIEKANQESLNVAGAGLEKARELLEKSRERVKGAVPVSPATPRNDNRKRTDTEVAHGT